LVDVGLLLQMQAAPADVCHFDRGLEAYLSLDGCVPRPRFRIEENGILCGYRQRERVACSLARVVNGAVRDGRTRLEGWVAAQEYGVTHSETGLESAAAGAEHRLIIERVSRTDARLKSLANMNSRVVIRQSMEQVIELSAVCRWNASIGSTWEAASWNHETVIDVAGARNRISGSRVNLHGVRRIIEVRIENRQISPKAVVRYDDGLTETIVEV
jgi:hypothetical protein